MYIVATQEVLNGFPYSPKVKTFETLEVAFKEFNKLTFGAQMDYPDSTPQVDINSPDMITYFVDEENQKGNGMFVLLATDDMLTAIIQDRVDNSKQRNELVTIGEKKTIREQVNTIYFSYSCQCKLKDGHFRVAEYIIKRDENPENKTGDELYEVFFDNGFCENIEEVSPDTLVSIFLETC